MDFGLSEEQRMVVDTVRSFVERELYPLEAEVEYTGVVSDEVGGGIRQKVLELGFYAANIPAEFGGGGLDHLTVTLLERELGRASMALTVHFGRPSRKYFRNAYARDAGLRIDHLLLSPSLRNRLVAGGIAREVRSWEKTSDHAPAWIELKDIAQSGSGRKRGIDGEET